MSIITHIKATAIALEQHEKDLIEQKLSILGDLIGNETAYVCDVEVARSKHHIHGDVFRVEVVCTIKGDVFRAEDTKDTLANALDEVRYEIERMIRSKKSRSRALFLKGARMLRNMMGKE